MNITRMLALAALTGLAPTAACDGGAEAAAGGGDGGVVVDAGAAGGAGGGDAGGAGGDAEGAGGGRSDGGGGGDAGVTDTADAGAADTAGAGAADAVGSTDGAGPGDAAGADGAGAADAVDLGPPPPTLAERGLVGARAALHVHSAYSHDACDGAGIDEAGVLNAPCVDRLRAAMCATGFDFVMLTDHPAHMSDYPFLELLHADPTKGDTVVTGTDGAPIANVLACDGPDGPRPVVVRVGFEGTHTMPVALQAHLDPLELEKVSLKDETSAEARAAVVEAIHMVGGVAVVAHSEETELSGSTIAGLPIEAMELYNFHANFNTILADAPERLIDLEAFLDPAPGGPDPDLVALIMLDVFPEPSIVKWREVAATRPITGVVGHDVHENVELTGYCTPGGQLGSLCGLLEDAFPHLIAALEKGGPLLLEDGDRLDSYNRIFGWMHNRLLVPVVEPGAEADALRTGRSYTIWSVLGEPEGLDVVAVAGGETVEVGGEVQLADAPVLWLRLPAAPVPGPQNRWAPVDVGGAALRAVLWRLVEGQAPEAVWESTTWGAEVAYAPDQPGAYQLELMLTPRHLAQALLPLVEPAERELRWAEANPIYVR